MYESFTVRQTLWKMNLLQKVHEFIKKHTHTTFQYIPEILYLSNLNCFSEDKMYFNILRSVATSIRSISTVQFVLLGFIYVRLLTLRVYEYGRGADSLLSPLHY